MAYYHKIAPKLPNGIIDRSKRDIDQIEFNATWNRWRRNYYGRPNLSNANFSYGYLTASDMDLYACDLIGVEFVGAILAGSILIEADLRGAQFQAAHIMDSSFDSANLTGANLARIHLLRCSLRNAILTDCEVYGLSAWDVDLIGAHQSNLTISDPHGHKLTVENIEIAQFIYLLLKSEKLRTVIDALTSKMVLILGRFTSERKAVLDAVKTKLTDQGYYPVIFDFDKPASRDLTETVSTLAHLSRFIIADLSDPRAIPHELASIVPTLAIPVQPIIIKSQKPYAMFLDFQKKYHWVLATYQYTDIEDLVSNLAEQIVTPAEIKAAELQSAKS